MHAGATTPAEPLDAVAISPNGDGIPLKRERSASAFVLLEACSAFTHVPACMVAKSPKVTRYTRVFQRVCYLLRRSGCFRPSDRLAGWILYPLEIAVFSRHTGISRHLSRRLNCETTVTVATRPGWSLPGRDFHLLERHTFHGAPGPQHPDMLPSIESAMFKESRVVPAVEG
jgi:hypothetical protein